MALLLGGRPASAARVALGLLLCSPAPAAAEDDPQAKERLELMLAALARLVPASDATPRAALEVVPRPLLRYSDPTRGGVKEAANVLLDGGVWRLGAAGRPTALVTVEVYQGPGGSRVLAFEFLSLTAARFSLVHSAAKIRWDATGSALELKELPDAPRPAATAAARLAQMRHLARRFAATEKIDQEEAECRLLAQPLERYSVPAEKVVDGALFALANGTNPEIGVVLEADGERWRYGVLRLSAAASRVTLDGRPVAEFAYYDPKGRTAGPYHNGSYKIEADR
jgi:hypothetical protein